MKDLKKGIVNGAALDDRGCHYGIDANVMGDMIESGEMPDNGIYVREKRKPQYKKDGKRIKQGSDGGKWEDQPDFIGIRTGELMDNIDSIVLIEKILEAYSAAIPVGKEVGKNPPGSKS